ncbi:DUF4141 domain-containing protein [Alistipes shahii]|jgi:hypothetical protein|uniref:DUF4141 domain-containing protein n=1 Tax=Alistipes shahii TaxID=328814 RepID=UPI00266F3783|nr:DUF4141 domain-containing protein [Alistipes shahii]
MRKTIILFVLLLISGIVKGQWVVSDPTNLAQSIVNSSNQIVHTSTTSANMLNNFQETMKIYKQGKQYYDALKAVKNLVRNARKVQQCILMVGEISDIYVTSYRRMLADENFSPQELAAIAVGYTKIIEESANSLRELQDIVNPTDLSLTDKDRLDVVDAVYVILRKHRNLARYYTRKYISVSMLRARERGNSEQVMFLYGSEEDKYW